MDQRKLHSQCICNHRGPLCSTCVGRDDYGVLVIRDIVLDPALQEGSTVEVIDGDIKEPLVLWVMKVHSDDMVRTGTSEEVGNESSSLRYPLFVPSICAVGGPVVIEAEAAAIGQAFRGVCASQWGTRDCRGV